jgi:anaerobic ribonucleoside-triphosphate reductase activating protein
MFSSTAHLISSSELATRIIDAASKDPALEGLTIIGGEPFDQALPLTELCQKLKAALPSFSILIFTGYVFEQLKENEHNHPLLHTIDLLIDGPFRADLPEALGENRRWLGSMNQRIHFLSNHYLELQESWPRGKNTVEFKLKDGLLSINGFPISELSFRALERKKTRQTK